MTSSFNEDFKKFISMDKTIREAVNICAAELIGTMIFMLVCCIGCYGDGHKVDNIVISLSYGIGVFMACQTVHHISGAHLNPVVTIASMFMELTTLPMAGIYMIGQFLGAIIGHGLTKLAMKTRPYGTTNAYCVTNLQKDYHPLRAVIMEFIATAVFVFVLCSMWDNRNKSNTSYLSLKRGLAVFGLVVAAGPFTTCSLNPARSLGPAIIMNAWTEHWVYWVGPFMGALLASSLYKISFWPPPSKDGADNS